LSHADEIIALEHHTVRINIDLAFAADEATSRDPEAGIDLLSFDDVIVVLFAFGLVIALVIVCLRCANSRDIKSAVLRM